MSVISYSHLDYCNVILYGISQTELAKFRLVLKRSWYDSSKQFLYDLHWLPIRARINFKILTYMFNCSVGNAPEYFTELLTCKVSKRILDPQNPQ